MSAMSSDLEKVHSSIHTIWTSVTNQHSAAGGQQSSSNSQQGNTQFSGHFAMVNVHNKSQRKRRQSLFKSLASSAVDSGNILKAVKRIHTNLEPSMIVIRNVGKLEDDNTKQAKEEVEKVKTGVVK